jgi:hypothetical protein
VEGWDLKLALDSEMYIDNDVRTDSEKDKKCEIKLTLL